ncbi:cytochrome P450 [Streptomyces sp. NPDC088116]|uniref:cytochrome P450 family protein n=1 Tax=Streptomyces sp. NPDC088116 TaxID=3365825 RepID=UPI00382FD984
MPCPRDPLPLDESFVAKPHASYAALRRTGPVHRAVSPDGDPLLLVTNYQEVRAAAMDRRMSVSKQHARTVAGHVNSLPAELDAHLLNSAPRAHARLRRLVSTAFTPRRAEGLRDAVQKSTDQLLDTIACHDRADVVADLALPLSMSVICDLMGIPADNRPDFRRWTDTLLNAAPGGPPRSREAMREMHRYLTELIDSKRGAPADDDLLSALIAARDEGDRLSESELVAMAFLLLFGGYDNVASLMASTVLALLTHPDQLAAVRGGELTMDAVTEETLRWNSPAMLAVRRFATEDIRMGGTHVPAGERVWLSWASANRDSERFANPDTFDPCREDTAHLAFGHGSHYCPGAALARMENNIAVTSLIQRFPDLSLAGPAEEPRWTNSLRSRRLRELPVTL